MWRGRAVCWSPQSKCVCVCVLLYLWLIQRACYILWQFAPQVSLRAKLLRVLWLMKAHCSLSQPANNRACSVCPQSRSSRVFLETLCFCGVSARERHPNCQSGCLAFLDRTEFIVYKNRVIINRKHLLGSTESAT